MSGIRSWRRTFWTINLRTRTYRAFRLSDPNRDADRIYNHLQQIGAPSSMENYTEWSTTYCGGDSEGYDGFVNVMKYGEYYNYDFGWNGWGTSIWQEAAVAYSMGSLATTCFNGKVERERG